MMDLNYSNFVSETFCLSLSIASGFASELLLSLHVRDLVTKECHFSRPSSLFAKNNTQFQSGSSFELYRTAFSKAAGAERAAM